MLIKILTVCALATFEIYAAIPTGFAMGLSPLTILLSSMIGGITGAFVTAFLGSRIRRFFFKNNHATHKKTAHPMLHRIWKKYGTVGLGFLGTFFVGAPISIAVAVGLNVHLRKLLPWCCIAVISRCTLLTLVGYYGLKLF